MSITIEAATWDEEQLRQELAIRMLPGLAFEVIEDLSINRWVVKIINKEGDLIWSGDDITSQLVLLGALGWVESKRKPTLESSPWVRRRGELDARRVHEDVFSKLSVLGGDPLDLDPREVQAVYSHQVKPR